MNAIDPAISTLTYRVAQAERKNEELELQLKQTVESLRQLRMELATGRALIRQQNEEQAKTVIAGILDEADIVVPEELKIRPSFKKRGKRRTGGGNRRMAIAQKRWALWRIQREQGYTFQQIARAWGCNHTAVCHAAKHNWQPYQGYQGGKR